MIDAHIHIERGPYTKEWIDHFVRQAHYMNLDEIWILEHCYRFREFVPMYDSVCSYSSYIDHWFCEKGGVLELSDYLRLVDEIRNSNPSIKIKFGLEVCYFNEYEDFLYQHTKNLELDFIVGSVHFVDNFAFDHKSEHWNTVDTDTVFRRYFDTSIELAKSGIFDGIAHPDSIKLFGHKPSFSLYEYYDKAAEHLFKNNMYAEMNSGCYRRSGCELGMSTEMLQYMKKHKVQIVTASDAHCPEDVGANIIEMTYALQEQ